jgi:hypothetical protein
MRPFHLERGHPMADNAKKAVNWAKRGETIGFGVVAAIAGIVSYFHMYETERTYTHELIILAIMVPLSVDGLMLVSMIRYKLNRGKGGGIRGWFKFRFWPAISTLAGLTVSGAANAKSSDFSGPVAIVEAIWPVLALFLAMQTIKDKLVTAGYSAQARSTQPVTPTKRTPPTKAKVPSKPTQKPTNVTDVRV